MPASIEISNVGPQRMGDRPALLFMRRKRLRKARAQLGHDGRTVEVRRFAIGEHHLAIHEHRVDVTVAPALEKELGHSKLAWSQAVGHSVEIH